MIRSLDTAALRERYRSAQPFPFLVLEDFLEPEAALRVARSYPPYAEAEKLGFAFRAVNENKKVQISDYDKFPGAAKELADALGSEPFRAALTEITGVHDLLWDGRFVGAGMHQTASSGLLDVHVDFNLLEPERWYRRLNLLLYLNPEWDPAWGGALELWDRDVARCCHTLPPALNRCVIFETSDHSLHGVTAVRCPPQIDRRSFAVYYYTKEAPAGWDGKSHSTIFKARPDEYLKKHLLMPAENLERQLKKGVQAAKGTVKKLIGR